MLSVSVYGVMFKGTGEPYPEEIDSVRSFLQTEPFVSGALLGVNGFWLQLEDSFENPQSGSHVLIT